MAEVGTVAMDECCANCKRVLWVDREGVVQSDEAGAKFCGKNCLWSFHLSSGVSRTRKTRVRNIRTVQEVVHESEWMQAGATHAVRSTPVAIAGGELMLSPAEPETQNAMFDYHRINFVSSAVHKPMSVRQQYIKAV